ncbi:F-box/FBD/LRR-repeat protein At4g26340-like [Lotus japonicus]|uniref:F-box/FBD/LRR-repeat protein At4g26340-like n=1 Tax=Lotus japonicus TaxID=34305 RepID=UPI00258677E9|nr:F-box/FBD/LRR-repeat protein At4g26340-like [Lotus japonicus]
MEDRLSILPDSILCRILSFLPTKQAVATSILSKKWKPLWRSVTTLHFDDAKYYTTSKEVYARFVQSVYAVILSRDQHQPINTFRLSCICSPCLDMAHVKVWLNAAAQRGVQHLDISFSFERLSSSTTIFTCKTLVVLKLKNLELKSLNFSVDLPFLKTLHLEQLVFPNHGCLAELLSGCPALVNLKVGRLYFPCFLIGKDEFKSLPKLVRAEISFLHKRLLKVVKNVEFLRLDAIGWGFLHDQGKDPQFSPMLHNLTRLELFYRHYNDNWLHLVEFLKYCPKLQVLLINQSHYQSGAFKAIKELGDWQYMPSAPECILLHLKSCYLNDYRGTEGELQFARYILQNGRFLKRMTICSDSSVNQQGKRKNFKKLSSCTRSSTTCKLSFN